MNRRKFCKLGAIAALGMALMPRNLFAVNKGKGKAMSGRCRLEVVRCQCFADLQSRYLDDPEAGPCSRYHVGDKIEVTPRNIRELLDSGKICPQAWNALRPYVEAALTAEATSECAPALAESQAIVSCPDGTRPVIFKITAG